MASETWRVVLASSEVREVEVESNGVQWCAFEDGYHGWGREQPSAVAAVVGLHGWPVAEILAPGEPTRAELRAQVEAYAAQLAPMTRAVDALRAAAVAAGHPAANGDPDAQLCAVRAAAWSAGAEAMRERCAARCDELAEQESELSRATAARGDQYNAAIRRDRAIARLQAAAEIRTLPVPPCPWGVCCGTGEVPR